MEVSFMAGDKITVPEKAKEKKVSRRAFVVGSGTALAGGALTVVSPQTATAATGEDYPKSGHYLVYDSKHCAGCYGCMTACSLSHEGEINFSLSRVQMHRAVLDEYPFDIQIHVCRQCPDPLCVSNCPTGAAHVSAEKVNQVVASIPAGSSALLTIVETRAAADFEAQLQASNAQTFSADISANLAAELYKHGDAAHQALMDQLT